MDCTNCKENCAFVKSGFISKDSDCPNYIESWWTQSNGNSPKLITDCFPKRCMIQISDQTMRNFALQDNLQNLRNEVLSMKTSLEEILAKSNEFLEQRIDTNVKSEIKRISELK